MKASEFVKVAEDYQNRPQLQLKNREPDGVTGKSYMTWFKVSDDGGLEIHQDNTTMVIKASNVLPMMDWIKKTFDIVIAPEKA